jgi:hypothetical protein
MSALQPWQQRVVAECVELEARRDALAEFIAKSKTFQDLGGAERDRLSRQLMAMNDYARVLDERIKAFRGFTP